VIGTGRRTRRGTRRETWRGTWEMDWERDLGARERESRQQEQLKSLTEYISVKIRK